MINDEYGLPVPRRTGARASLVLALMVAVSTGVWHMHQMDTEALQAATHETERYADLQQHCIDRELDRAGSSRMQP